MIPNLKAKLSMMRKDNPAAAAAPSVPCDAPSCRRIRRVYPWAAAVSQLSDWEKLSIRDLSLLFREDLPRSLSFRDLLFMDTETTGLSTGAGTVAFLIGVGYFSEDGFVVEQFFLEDLDQESDALSAYQEILSRCRAVVTYNGKNYDLPLLQTRFVMNRLRPREPSLSLDLLYPARRFFRGRYASCSLSVLEEERLGIARGEDIPGAQIPAAYFDYLKTRDETQISKILSHNRQDLVSLAELLLHMAGLQSCGGGGDPELTLACARNHMEMGEAERALPLLEEASFSLAEAAEELIWLYKRRGDFESAYRVSKAWTQHHRGGLEIRELQAKLEEHWLRDYASALENCRQALDILNHTGSVEDWDRWRHRRQRLLRKSASKENT